MKAALAKVLAAAGVRLTGVAGWLISLVLPPIIEEIKKGIGAWLAKRKAEKEKQKLDEAQKKYEAAGEIEDDEARKKARAEALCDSDPNCPKP